MSTLDVSSTIDVSSITTCAVCMDTFLSPVRLKCNHVFCAECWDATRKGVSPSCPMCRHPQRGPGAPDVTMNNLVEEIPRRRPCGTQVSQSSLPVHEETCASCAIAARRSLQRMVGALLKQNAKLQSQLKAAQVGEKRARDENDRSNDEVAKFCKRLHDKDARARRQQYREQQRQCTCDGCVTWARS